VIVCSRELRESMSNVVQRGDVARAFFRKAANVVRRFIDLQEPVFAAMMAEAGLAAARRAHTHAAEKESQIGQFGTLGVEQRRQLWRFSDPAHDGYFFADTVANAWLASLATFVDAPSERYRLDRALHSAWDAAAATTVALLRCSAAWCESHGMLRASVEDRLRAAWTLAGQKSLSKDDCQEIRDELVAVGLRLRRLGENGFAAEVKRLADASEGLRPNPSN
jgi:hypothetical protein